MRSTLSRHPRLAIFLALAVAMEVALFATSRDVAIGIPDYLVMFVTTFGLAGLCSWILTWE